jgi:hypothetical protein
MAVLGHCLRAPRRAPRLGPIPTPTPRDPPTPLWEKSIYQRVDAESAAPGPRPPCCSSTPLLTAARQCRRQRRRLSLFAIIRPRRTHLQACLPRSRRGHRAC